MVQRKPLSAVPQFTGANYDELPERITRLSKHFMGKTKEQKIYNVYGVPAYLPY